jgi:H+/Cl- antiporter ClcA
MKPLTASVQARWLIKGAGALLTLLYGWLTLEWKPIQQLTRSLPAHILLQLAVILYFVAWLYGSIWDVDAQESAYVRDAVAPPLSPRALVAAAVIVVLFTVLCWRSHGPRTWFALSVLAFWFANVAAWEFAVKPELATRVATSRASFEAEKRNDRVLVLEETVHYEIGRWQMLRFCVGSALLLAVNVVTWGGWLPRLAEKAQLAPDIVFSLTVLAFVLISEGWIWYKRLELRTTRTFIEDVAERFTFAPRASGGA